MAWLPSRRSAPSTASRLTTPKTRRIYRRRPGGLQRRHLPVRPATCWKPTSRRRSAIHRQRRRLRRHPFRQRYRIHLGLVRRSGRRVFRQSSGHPAGVSRVEDPDNPRPPCCPTRGCAPTSGTASAPTRAAMASRAADPRRNVVHGRRRWGPTPARLVSPLRRRPAWYTAGGHTSGELGPAAWPISGAASSTLPRRPARRRCWPGRRRCSPARCSQVAGISEPQVNATRQNSATSTAEVSITRVPLVAPVCAAPGQDTSGRGPVPAWPPGGVFGGAHSCGCSAFREARQKQQHAAPGFWCLRRTESQIRLILAEYLRGEGSTWTSRRTVSKRCALPDTPRLTCSCSTG